MKFRINITNAIIFQVVENNWALLKRNGDFTEIRFKYTLVKRFALKYWKIARGNV